MFHPRCFGGLLATEVRRSGAGWCGARAHFAGRWSQVVALRFVPSWQVAESRARTRVVYVRLKGGWRPVVELDAGLRPER
jgi:hypothetical protein